MKPSPKSTRRWSGRPAAGAGRFCIWTDRAENVAAGLARGWRAALHETPEENAAPRQEPGPPGGTEKRAHGEKAFGSRPPLFSEPCANRRFPRDVLQWGETSISSESLPNA